MDVYAQGKKVRLTQAEFKAQGGEGAVYVKGDTAYKVYADPAKAIPPAKIAELAALTLPEIVCPREVLWDAHGTPIGYTMRVVPDAYALCQTFPRTFRERMGLTPDTALHLVRLLQEGVQHVHGCGLLVVDLNEMNFLVDTRFERLHFIDVDSYQTPHFPATALIDSVRDRHAQGWNQGTDWFSFAVVSFQMFAGIHPYKGKHPALKTLEERMCANVSVLNPSVGVPAACLPFDVIPTAYREWYRAVLEEGRRVPPPDDPFAVVTLPAPAAPRAASALLTVEALGECPSGGAGVWIAWTPALGHTVRATLEQGKVRLHDLDRGQDLTLDLAGEQLMTAEGRLYVKSGGSLLEVGFVETPQRVWPQAKVVGQVLEQATQLFEGVALQSLLGAWYASLLPAAGLCRQVRLTELDGWQVVDAKFQGGVLMAVGVRGGRYRKLVFRFSAGYDAHDLRTVEDPQAPGINFVVLDHAVCLHLNDAEELEVFPARMGAAGMRTLADPALRGDCLLTKEGSQARFVRDGVLHRLAMR